MGQFMRDFRTGYQISKNLDKPISSIVTKTAPFGAGVAQQAGLVSGAVTKGLGHIATLGIIANEASNVGGGLMYATMKSVGKIR